MMFIAMIRFRVKKGSEEAFEQVWLSRDTQLTKVPGFVECLTVPLTLLARADEVID
jgi:heme-degrading monooxygenase HmoA